MKLRELLEFELPKNQWIADISNGAKNEVGDELVDLVKTAYSRTPQGSFVNSIKDVVPSDWHIIDFDQDPDVDSCIFYRGARSGETWQGKKIQGIGHDGTSPSKQKVIARTTELLGKSGWWIESSDAMRAVLKKFNVKPITDEKFLQKLFNDPDLKMIDSDTYQRRIGSKIIEETVFGNPILKI